jgi:hypothetical protein
MVKLNDFSAAAAFVKALKPKRNEKVLILTDNKSNRHAIRILKRYFEREKSEVLVNDRLPLGYRDDFPDFLLPQLEIADIIILAASGSWYHAKTRKIAKYNLGKRVVECYGLSLEMLRGGALTASPQEMRQTATAIMKLIKVPAKLKITSSFGTDFHCEINRAIIEDGDFSAPGTGGNLPAGEISFSLAPHSAQGRVIFDVSCDRAGSFSWVSLEIKDGNITAVKGKRIVQLKKDFKFYPALVNVAEVGIGINQQGIVGRAVLEDEKILGYVHLGFGNDTYFGGRIDGPHYDGVMSGATVVMSGRKLCLENYKRSSGIFAI